MNHRSTAEIEIAVLSQHVGFTTAGAGVDNLLGGSRKYGNMLCWSSKGSIYPTNNQQVTDHKRCCSESPIPSPAT